MILLLIGLLLILGTGFSCCCRVLTVALETATVQQAKDSAIKQPTPSQRSQDASYSALQLPDRHQTSPRC